MKEGNGGKYYAYAQHETVQAMLHSLFRFSSAMQAQLVCNRFADEMIVAPRMRDPKDRTAVFLWVRDLDVTVKQREQGYLGNFAKVSLVKLPSGKWTLSMVRVDVPLAKHPVWKKVERRYPNASHPVLRMAERRKSFPSMQAAFDALMAMHEEYPEVSIPGVGKLKIMVYQKAGKGETPIQKIELNVVKREGGYFIEAKDAARSAKHLPPAADAMEKAVSEKPSKEVAGFYTKMVSRRKKRKV